MSPDGNNRLGNVLGYTIPRLHEGKEWYVDFKAFDPSTGKLKRKKFFIPKLPKKKERREVAIDIIVRLTDKLRTGWTPWAEVKNVRGTNKIDEMLTRYINHIKLGSRPRTIASYTSRVNVLREYMKTLKFPPIYCYQYTRTFILDFLDWIIEERGGNARTRNNYRQWCGAFGQFLVERECLEENPVDKIPSIKENDKTRQPMNQKQLERLMNFLAKTDRPFLLACMMEYYTFIRPGELRHVRIRDINLKEQSIFIPASVSKNRKDGKVSINEEIIKLMLELDCLTKPGDWYLFGPELLTSPEQAYEDTFNRNFAKVRARLRFPFYIKFYSLKDSGIRDLTESTGIITAQNQARHSDVATTNKYLQGRDREAPEKAKHFVGALKASVELPLEDL